MIFTYPMGRKGHTVEKFKLWPKLGSSSLASRVPCHYCRRPLTFSQATVDHDPPLNLPYSNPDLYIACSRCNESRGRIACRVICAYRARLYILVSFYLKTEFNQNDNYFKFYLPLTLQIQCLIRTPFWGDI